MKKALLFYFSGTGGTERCARLLKEHLAEAGYQTDTYEMALPLKPIPDLSAYDLLGFGYPIHAFNVPLTFLRFVKKNIPHGDKPFFIFKVSGEPLHLNDASSLALYRILKHKGYRFVMEKHFLMPYNIIFRYPDPMVKEMALYLDALTKGTALRLARGIKEKPHYPFFKRCLSFLLRIEWLAPAVNAGFVRVDQKKCVNCNRCIKQCPNQAVYRDKKGRIRLSNHCSLCMRCVMNCPADAFHFGWLNNWKVVGPYPYDDLLFNPQVPCRYTLQKKKDYFRHFTRYFHEQDAFLEAEGISLEASDGVRK
jgi:ferredoxin